MIYILLVFGCNKERNLGTAGLGKLDVTRDWGEGCGGGWGIWETCVEGGGCGINGSRGAPTPCWLDWGSNKER